MILSGAVQSIRYGDAPQALRRQFAVLRHRADPDARSMPEDSVPVLHDPSLDALSFYVWLSGAVISYAAVVRKTLGFGAESFIIGGLCSVATDPDHRGKGFGGRTVGTATRWMERSGIDFGIFSCDPPLATFYWRAGGWPIAPGVVLIGSRQAGALRSDSLGKVVLMRLFSAKAHAAESMLRNTTIDLGLPVGQFL